MRMPLPCAHWIWRVCHIYSQNFTFKYDFISSFSVNILQNFSKRAQHKITHCSPPQPFASWDFFVRRLAHVQRHRVTYAARKTVFDRESRSNRPRYCISTPICSGHWPWPMTLTFNPRWAVAMSHTHTYTHTHTPIQKLMFKGQSVQKIDKKQTDGQRTLPIVLSFRLTRSVIIRFVPVVNSVATKVRRFSEPGSPTFSRSGAQPNSTHWTTSTWTMRLAVTSFALDWDCCIFTYLVLNRDFALLTTATWSCRAPTLTDSVGAAFLCLGRTNGTSCHLTFGKCPINQFCSTTENFLISKQHWQALLRITSKGGL